MNQYLKETALLDFNHHKIIALVDSRGWNTLSIDERIRQIYTFVRDEILFGYNESDDIPSSQILNDHFGQCNTKGTLFMSLLRATNIPCRIHGFTIDKKVQKGIITGLVYRLSPKEFLHSWVELFYQDTWICLEGIIIDKGFLTGVQNLFPNQSNSFCGYGIATSSLQNPLIDWEGKDTFIQDKTIVQDFGVFDSPDAFYRKHGTNLARLKRFLYRHIIRKRMNSKVRKIRGEKPAD